MLSHPCRASFDSAGTAIRSTRSAFVAYVRQALALGLLALTVLAASPPLPVASMPRTFPFLFPVAELGGEVTTLLVSGERAYVAVGERIQVMTLGPDGSAKVLGISEPLGTRIRDLAIGAERLYAVGDTVDLTVLDVSVPDRPKRLAGFNWGMEVKGLAVDGTTVVLAAGSMGVVVVDVSDSLRPQILFLEGLDQVESSQNALGIELVGRMAYIASDFGGLRIMDLTVASRPRLVGQLFGGNFIGYKVVVQGRLAYLAAGFDGLQVVDVADPAVPRLVGHWESELSIVGLAVVDRVAYVAESNTTNPRLDRFGRFSWGSLVVLDVADLDHITERGRVALQSLPSAIAWRSGVAWLAAGTGGLRAFRVSTRESPVPLDQPLNLRPDLGSVLLGTTAVVATLTGCVMLDLDQPERPAVLGSYDGFEQMTRMAAAPGWVVLVGLVGTERGQYVLRLLDLRDSRRPLVAAGGLLSAAPNALALHDGRIYLGTDAGVRILEMAPAGRLREIGAYRLPGEPVGLAVANGRVYSLEFQGRLQSTDVTDPGAPQVLGWMQAASAGKGVVVSGTIAYVAAADEGLVVVDVSDPAAMRRVSTLEFPRSSAHHLASAAGMALVTTSGVSDEGEFAERLHWVDLSDASRLREIGSRLDLGYAALGDSLALAAARNGGLVILRRTLGPRVYLPVTLRLPEDPAKPPLGSDGHAALRGGRGSARGNHE